MLSDVCLSDVCHVHPVGGRRVRPAGWIARIGWSGPARPAWLKAAAARFRCRPGRGHIVAATRLQLLSHIMTDKAQTGISECDVFWPSFLLSNISRTRSCTGKVPYSYWSVGGVLISLPKAMSPYVVITTIVCDAWPVRRQIYGYLYSGFLIPFFVSPSCGNICLCQEGFCFHFVCLFTRLRKKTTRPIFTKFSGKVEHGYGRTQQIFVVVWITLRSHTLQKIGACYEAFV